MSEQSTGGARALTASKVTEIGCGATGEPLARAAKAMKASMLSISASDASSGATGGKKYKSRSARSSGDALSSLEPRPR